MHNQAVTKPMHHKVQLVRSKSNIIAQMRVCESTPYCSAQVQSESACSRALTVDCAVGHVPGLDWALAAATLGVVVDVSENIVQEHIIRWAGIGEAFPVPARR
jgi:hypothetical protein